MKSLAVVPAVAMAAMVYSASASAGCALTITFDNDLSKQVTVLQVDSLATAGKWKSAYTKDFTVGAGKKLSKAIEIPQGCGSTSLRVKYKVGASSKYVNKGSIATLVKKKITIEFDD
ncbi:MAG: hypothetical protein R3E48_00625 [Burkholderiaceae bacterium]